MSFSESDLMAAFDCAEERLETGKTQRALVTEHLLGTCDCARNRCKECGGRPRNLIQRHTDGCSMGLSKKT